MHPAVTPMIREAINLRYRWLPYFYTLFWQSCVEDEPMLRPTFLDHEDDPLTFQETDDFMLGRDVLVASVVSQGERSRSVYLPKNRHGWYDYHSGQWHAGGQTIVLDAPLERLPLLVRAGAALPMSGRCAHVDVARDDQRELLVFAVPGQGESSGVLFEDDGESRGWEQGNALWIEWTLRSDAQRIDLQITQRGDFRPAWAELAVKLSQGETRSLFINGTPTDRYHLR